MSGIATLLTYSFTLQRSVQTQDASGGVSRTWSDVLQNVPLSVQPASARTVTNYAIRQQVVSHKLYTNIDMDAAASLLGGTVGGAKIGDRWSDGAGNYYLVKDYYKRFNPAITPEPLCVTDCELQRP